MSLRTFCLRIFQHCPLLASFSTGDHIKAFEEFLQYKTRVPVRGAIMLNHEMDSTVLVKGWKKGANWSFPRGKINKDEDDLDCAIREVWEETGLDLRAAGLVPEGKPKYIEITMREQQMRLYVFRNIPMNTHFQPQTRKEISKIEWYKLSELPAFRKKGTQNPNEEGAASNANKFYMVAPFLVPLKKWVVSQKKLETKRVPTTGSLLTNPSYSLDEAPIEDDNWTHAPAAHPPAVDSLEGATNELQRLLKLQPLTQGLQQPQLAQEDKASALLSMLKSKDVRPAQMNPNTALPHTPLDLTTEQAPQPRNPHHHTNQHPSHIHTDQPPPHFPILQQHQQHQQQNLQWNAPQYNNYQAHPQTAREAPLIHPQPLPPQVQRAMFNQSTFQENLANSQARQNQQSGAYGSSGAPLQQPSNNPPAPQPLRLDGQSMALLNAFKKNPGQAPAVQPVPHQGYVHQGDATNDLNFPSYKASGGARDTLPLSELAGSSSQTLATNHPPKAQPVPNEHRSALLDMFRNEQSSPPVVKEATKPKQQQQQQQPITILSRHQGAGGGLGGGMERQLLDTLRRAPMPADPQPNLPSQAPSYSTTETTAALSDFLALKPRQDQAAQAAAASRMSPEHSSSLSRPTHSTSSNQPPLTQQPIRILQRGNPVDGQRFASPADRSQYANRAPTSSSVGYVSPANVPPLSSPGASARRPEPSQDQKRQLLSLFGGKQKQAQQQSFTGQGGQGQPSIELAAGDFSRSRLASFASGSGDGSFAHGPPSRGGKTSGTQTPISPADQSFLLDYLQSVTNKASR